MGRVEVRSYDGDGRDLAEFVQRVWRTTFQGKKWFPLWDQEFFKWRALDPRIGNRELCLAAYEENAIVGCILAEAIDLQIGNESVRGSYSSWLSVDPRAKNPVVGMRLVQELRARHQAQDIRLSVGCTHTDPTSPSRRFWDTLARRFPDEFRFLQPIRFWAHVLNPWRVAAAGLTHLERWGPRALGLIPRPRFRRRIPDCVRACQPSDLDDCLRWIDIQSAPSGLRMLWNEPRLELQLMQCDYPRTIVLDDGDGPLGFLNYYAVSWLGACEIQVGMIDLFAGDIGWRRQRQLLASAEQRMRDEKIDISMMMISRAAPGRVLLSQGYVPVQSHLDRFCMFLDPRVALPPRPICHLLFA